MAGGDLCSLDRGHKLEVVFLVFDSCFSNEQIVPVAAGFSDGGYLLGYAFENGRRLLEAMVWSKMTGAGRTKVCK